MPRTNNSTALCAVLRKEMCTTSVLQIYSKEICGIKAPRFRRTHWPQQFDNTKFKAAFAPQILRLSPRTSFWPDELKPGDALLLAEIPGLAPSVLMLPCQGPPKTGCDSIHFPGHKKSRFREVSYGS